MNDTKIPMFPSSGLAPFDRTFLPLAAKPWTLAASLRFCRELAASHYENFPVALRWFDREQQDALSAVYAFSRMADDFADEPKFRPVRVELLNAWREQLTASMSGEEMRHPVFIALGHAVKRFHLDPSLLDDLLSAFLQDCRVERYETMDDVLDYCRRSANPVGRLVLRILGQDGEQRETWSDAICTALQLTNFWQDLSVDLPRGRCYIPLEWLKLHGLNPDELLASPSTRRHAELIAFLVDDTRERFRLGKPLVFSVHAPANLYLAGVYLGGRTVLRMVRDFGPRVFNVRPSLGKRAVTRAWWNAGTDRLLATKEATRWTH